LDGSLLLALGRQPQAHRAALLCRLKADAFREFAARGAGLRFRLWPFFSIPKGLNRPAQGCAERATLGENAINWRNSKGVESGLSRVHAAGPDIPERGVRPQPATKARDGSTDHGVVRASRASSPSSANLSRPTRRPSRNAASRPQSPRRSTKPPQFSPLACSRNEATCDYPRQAQFVQMTRSDPDGQKGMSRVEGCAWEIAFLPRRRVLTLRG